MRGASPRPSAAFLLPLLLLALTACGGGGSGASSASDTIRATQPVAATPRVSTPAEVRIPAIGAASSLLPTGLLADGTLETPPVDTPLQASWFDGTRPGEPESAVYWTVPGEQGPPAVVLGHVDGDIGGRAGQPGVFHRLAELSPGDVVEIEAANGAVSTFEVNRVERHDKDSFPTDDVYRDLGIERDPQLRLITCGGAFDRAAGAYEDNVIVWATEIYGEDH